MLTFKDTPSQNTSTNSKTVKVVTPEMVQMSKEKRNNLYVPETILVKKSNSLRYNEHFLLFLVLKNYQLLGFWQDFIH